MLLPCRLILLLIVPMWNWNTAISAMLVKLLVSFNRTNVELKWQRIHFAFTGSMLLIVPMWNWNMSASMVTDEQLELLIVPMWNWNMRGVLRVRKLRGLLIVPMWNWNRKCCQRYLYWWHSTFNRTNVELKLTQPLRSSTWTNSFNRTNVELKWVVYIKVSLLQLYF